MSTQSFIMGALKRISAARRTAQPPKPPAGDAATIEFLYVPCTRARYNGRPGETRRWVQEVPVVKKTAKLIYYTSDSWNSREAVVSPGCISREQFEADTRCHREDLCRHGYPAGVIPIPADRRRAAPAGRLFFASREAAEGELRRGERARQTGRAGNSSHQGVAPHHGRRPSRPRRHGRPVHPGAPPLRCGASASATITGGPR